MRTHALRYCLFICTFIVSSNLIEIPGLNGSSTNYCQAGIFRRGNCLPRRQVRQCHRQHAHDLSDTIAEIDSLPLNIHATWDRMTFSTDFARLLTILSNSPSMGLPNINASEGILKDLPGAIAEVSLVGDHVSISWKHEVKIVLDMPNSKLPVKAEFLVLGEEGKPLEFDIVIDKKNPKLIRFTNVSGARILLEKGKHTFPHELKFDDSGEKFKAVIVVDNPMPKPRGLAGVVWPRIVPVHLQLKPEELKMLQAFMPRIIHIYSEIRIALHTGDFKRLMALMPEMRLRHKLQMLRLLKTHNVHVCF